MLNLKVSCKVYFRWKFFFDLKTLHDSMQESQVKLCDSVQDSQVKHCAGKCRQD